METTIEAIFRWHATTYLTLIPRSTIVISDQSSDDKSNKIQVTSNV